LGWVLHKTPGGLAAGILFVLPSALLLWGLSWAYVGFGSLPWMVGFLCGLKPAVLAIVAAVPMGLLSASNVAPAWVYQPVRRLMDACRATNEMVFAMLFIVAVGLGPFAGVLALFVHTTGTLSKLFSEAVEAIDPRPVEGIRATGAHKLAEIAYGVIPQVMPLWLSYSLYRFESNVRSASVVGMVGAGGIGVILFEVIRSFEYAQTCAVLLMLIVTVSLIDMVSSWLRQRFI
jgi:phosphonate transport system permease protein